MAFISQNALPSGPVRARRFDHPRSGQTSVHIELIEDGFSAGYISMDKEEARQLIFDLTAVVADIDGDNDSGVDDHGLSFRAFPDSVAGEC